MDKMDNNPRFSYGNTSRHPQTDDFSTMYTTGEMATWKFGITVYGSVIALKKLFAFELTTNMVLLTCGSSILVAGILIYIIKVLFNSEKVMFNA